MARPAKGTVEHRVGKDGRGKWWGRITLHNGARPWIDLGEGPNSLQGRARAQEKAAHYTERAREAKLEAVPQRGPKALAAKAEQAAVGETFDAYAVRWFAEREARGLSSLSTDRSRIRVHVSPTLGPKPITSITAADLRAVCRHLDETARASEGFSWRTGAKVWGLVTKLFDDACESKVESLRVLTANPCQGVRGPDAGTKKSKQWLRPRELVQLAGCAEVPLRWRRLYVLASYLYLRPGELAALEWRDVHLAEGYALIHQAFNLEAGSLKATKTGTSRRVKIRPALVPLLEAMKAEAGAHRRVVQNTHDNKLAEHGMPPTEDLAATLRVHLLRAGVDRADLHDVQPTTKRITFYDLRASGITWEVLDGTDHVVIMQRAGHANFSTTQGYIREAETLGENVGEPFGPLPESLLKDETPSGVPGVSSIESSEGGGSTFQPAAFLLDSMRPQGDSKARSASRSSTNTAQSGSLPVPPEPSGRDPSLPNSPIVGGARRFQDETLELGGVTTPALVRALQLAAKAGRWAAVAQLAAELGARDRRDGAPVATSVSIAERAAKRG